MAFFKGRHVTEIPVKLGNTRVFHAYLHGFTETRGCNMKRHYFKKNINLIGGLIALLNTLYTVV